jgi:hypothetical protein
MPSASPVFSLLLRLCLGSAELSIRRINADFFFSELATNSINQPAFLNYSPVKNHATAGKLYA